MDKLKQKLLVLRSEIDQADARTEYLRDVTKQLESAQLLKEHDVRSLQTRIQMMEEQLASKESHLQIVHSNYKETNLQAEKLESRISTLEQELDTAEVRTMELQISYKMVKDDMEAFEKEIEVA